LKFFGGTNHNKTTTKPEKTATKPQKNPKKTQKPKKPKKYAIATLFRMFNSRQSRQFAPVL